MKRLFILLPLLLLAGCVTGHGATLDRIVAACQGEVLKVDIDDADYRKRLRFECRE